MTEKLSGGCLCGGVTYSTDSEPAIVGHCYCVDCRKSSGTSHCTHVAVPEASMTLNGDVTVYARPADSGNVVSRAFCGACGSAVYSTNSGLPGMMFIRASSLDDLDQVSPQMTVYASRAPRWAMIDTTLPVFQEMPEGGPAAVLE